MVEELLTVVGGEYGEYGAAECRLAQALQERTHTRDIGRLGGLWSTVPRMGGVGLLFALASLGLPGLGNFVAEFLILLGAYQANVTLTVLATVGLITATVYALWMVQQTFHGPNTANWKLPDFGGREMLMMAMMIAIIVWLGLYPQPVLNTVRPALDQLQHSTAAVQQPLMSTLNVQVVWPQLDHSTLDHGSNP